MSRSGTADDDRLTPSRFIKENMGGLGFTPSLLTSYAEENLFEQSFKGAAAAAASKNGNTASVQTTVSSYQPTQLCQQQQLNQQRQHQPGYFAQLAPLISTPAGQIAAIAPPLSLTAAATATSSGVSLPRLHAALPLVAVPSQQQHLQNPERNGHFLVPPFKPAANRTATNQLRLQTSQQNILIDGKQRSAGGSSENSRSSTPNSRRSSTRKRRRWSVEANGFEYDDDASSMGSGGSDDDKFTPEEKRKKFLERNRLAASRCRQKKKEKMQAMQRENEETVQENLRLRSFIQQMELEMQELKQMLLMHNGSCDCSDIKQFIRNHPRLFDSSAPTERRQQQRQ